MLMDLHMHEKRNSADSFISLEEMVFRAREMGLDGICITDHDAMGLVEFAAAFKEGCCYPVWYDNGRYVPCAEPIKR